jgi:Tfp pilus assembly protein PilO
MRTPMGLDFSRVYREKRRVILPLAILAVANLAALILLVYPLSRRVATTEQRAQDTGIQLARATQEYRAARATLEGRERTDKQLARFYAEVLPKDQTAARRITYLKLAQLARDSDLLYERRSFATDVMEKDSALMKMDIAVPLNGEYADMRRFIHTLETAPEFIVIREVQLAKSGDQKKSSLTLTLNLSTFYRVEASAEGAGAGTGDRDRR